MDRFCDMTVGMANETRSISREQARGLPDTNNEVKTLL